MRYFKYLIILSAIIITSSCVKNILDIQDIEKDDKLILEPSTHIECFRDTLSEVDSYINFYIDSNPIFTTIDSSNSKPQFKYSWEIVSIVPGRGQATIKNNSGSYYTNKDYYSINIKLIECFSKFSIWENMGTGGYFDIVISVTILMRYQGIQRTYYTGGNQRIYK